MHCRWALLMIAMLAAVDFAWNWWAGLQFHGWAHTIGAVLAMWALAAFYQFLRPRPEIAETAIFAGLWIAFTVMGAILTYLGASLGRPLVDDVIAGADRAVGFDWPAWFAFIHLWPAAHMLVRGAYYSLMVQVVATIIIVSVTRLRGRNEELLLNAGVALVFTAALATWFPTMGAFFHYQTEAFNPADSAFVGHMLLLRQGHIPPFALDDIQGIISFPSFHAVLACLFVYAHRGLKWSFPVVLAINTLMLFGIPTEGGHYLSDVAGGILVAVIAIASVAAVSRRSRSAQSSSARTSPP